MLLIGLLYNCAYRTETNSIHSNPNPSDQYISSIPVKSKNLTPLSPAYNNIYQNGVASWYGDKFHGKRTANGEIYNMYKLTAAHKTLPFNTILEVKNLQNQKSVLVRINDRGPFVKNRIIDLSYKSAQILGIDVTGTELVQLRIMKQTHLALKSKTNPQIRFKTNEVFFLQAGAFGEIKNAQQLLKLVQIVLPDLNFEIYFKDGFYKIISKRIESKDSAEKYKNILKEVDIDVFIKSYR